jgi:hypothetical protein
MLRRVVSQRESVANVLPGSTILVSLMMDALCSSETYDFTRATRRNILKDGILQKKFLILV